jgi:hypothetical protein
MVPLKEVRLELEAAKIRQTFLTRRDRLTFLTTSSTQFALSGHDGLRLAVVALKAHLVASLSSGCLREVYQNLSDEFPPPR